MTTVRVMRSGVIDAPVDAVWDLLRDFNGHAAWHPAVAVSAMEHDEKPDQVGGVRAFRLQDGGFLREQLVALSDRERSLGYALLEAPVPLNGYVARMQLRPVTDGDRTLLQWESRFTPPPERAAALADLVARGIYEAGIAALQARFRPERAPIPTPAPTPRPAPTPPVASTVAAPTVASAGALEAEAIVIDAYGGPEVLRPRRVTVPPPGPGEVRLRHTAIGVNYIDVYARTGYYPLIAPPGIPGMEAAGIVLDVGPGVDGLLPGDRVAYACAPTGAYAAFRTMKADLIVRLPDAVSDRLAAAVMLKGMSAEFLLHRVHAVQAGDTILVHAAAGGVGQLLCQWARHLGATVIGTVGSRDKAAVARAAGCAYPIVYTETDFVAAVADITGGRGCDVVYDAVGADTFMQSYAALAQRGHLVSYGQASGPIPPIDIAAFSAKSATVSRPNFGHYTATPAEVGAICDRLFRAIADGVIRPEIGQEFALRAAAEAHHALEGRRTIGATILIP
jgi:NADPH:quinone reductase-like Zn-dependent oxidoreductase